MIDNFLGIDTGGGGGGGDTGHWFLPYNAACSDDSFFIFIKDRSSLQYFITQGMGQSSMFLTFRTICNFRGRALGYLSIMKPA